MKIKAIALDLDGTLLNSEKEISIKNLDILKKIEKKGIKIIIVTGRSYPAAKKFAEILNIGDIIITYNGAKVVNYRTDESIFHLPLGGEYVQKIIKLGRGKNIHINLYQGNKWFVENIKTLETKRYSEITGLSPIEKDFNSFDSYEMTKISIQDMERSPKFDELYDEIRRDMGNDLYITKSHDFLIEVLNKNINKGVVLEKILKNYNISLDECIAFGDALNDLEMLTMVKYGVAMGNACEELKSEVNYITDTNDNDGVAKFLVAIFRDMCYHN